MSGPSKTEILLSVRRIYILLECLEGEMLWAREHLTPDIVKMINEAKAKNNYLKKNIIRGMSNEAKQIVEDRAIDMHEQIIKLLKNE
jgi:hypothetical protein